MVDAANDFYLPEECWEHVFKFLNEEDNNHIRYFKSLSRVSKQFLSITNRLRFSLVVSDQTVPFLFCLFHRFPNLISLHLKSYHDLDNLLRQISSFSLNLTSLILCYQTPIPVTGLRVFSQNTTTLTSLTCSVIDSLGSTDIFLIADCFPNLQRLDLNHCHRCDISEESIGYLLRKCCNIKHLNLNGLFGLRLPRTNLGVLKLEVLDLSYTNVDDQILYAISMSCRGLLQLILKHCCDIRKKGVMHVVENCTQLREINLKYSPSLHDINANDVASMIFLRSSLRKIIVPFFGNFRDREFELWSSQGCFVC